MSNSANARPRKSSGIACCTIVSADTFPRKKEKNPRNSITANPATETNAPPMTPPMPSSAIDVNSIRTGATRSFSFCATTMPVPAPSRPPRPESTSDRVSASPPSARFFA